MAATAGSGAGAADEIVVVGAGLVGTMLTVALAKQGYRVTLIERRDDIRKEHAVEDGTEGSPFGLATSPTKRSINLALSHRGIVALEAIGVKDTIMEHVIPMHCRAMHGFGGELTFMPYGKKGQHINSVSRGLLNHVLLEAAAAHDNVTLMFNCKVTSVRKDATITFINQAGAKCTRRARLVVGADGAFSAVRNAMMRLMRLDFDQHYIEHGYKELTMPPKISASGERSFAMEPVNALHIWPRHEFMMIALPNPDFSYTCTLFAPFELLQKLDNDPDTVPQFFDTTFPDSVPHLEDLVGQFKENPTGSLVTVHAKPWAFEDKVMLMGDAAHGLVPFYGQGMNAGFEDVSTFINVLESCGNDLSRAVPEWAKSRKPRGDAIAELSYRNYVEMRSHTASRAFLLRKRFEAKLHSWFPTWWIPLYTMVAFTSIPYDEAIKREEKQDRAISRMIRFGAIALAAAVIGGGYFGYRSYSRL